MWLPGPMLPVIPTPPSFLDRSRLSRMSLAQSQPTRVFQRRSRTSVYGSRCNLCSAAYPRASAPQRERVYRSWSTRARSGASGVGLEAEAGRSDVCTDGRTRVRSDQSADDPARSGVGTGACTTNPVARTTSRSPHQSHARPHLRVSRGQYQQTPPGESDPDAVHANIEAALR